MADPETIGGAGIIGTVLAGLGLRFESGRKQIVRLVGEVKEELVDLNKVVGEVQTMHKHPDDFGFGSVETDRKLQRVLIHLDEDTREQRELHELVKDSTRAMRDLTQTIRQSLEATGHVLPPILPKP